MTTAFATLFVLSLSAANPVPSDTAGPRADDRINAVLGDRSWIAAHGVPPTARAGERERIATHLAYVGRLLAAVDVSHLGAAQRARRRRLLQVLERYRLRGRFPRRVRDPYRGRRPRFIDHRGVHCAVGYLIAASGAPQLARSINARYEYAYVREIRSPALRRWAARQGFTVRELAMIQPGYRGPPTEDYTRQMLQEAVPRITVACARRHPPGARLVLVVAGQPSGHIQVSTPTGGAFARCFAARAAKVHVGAGGAYAGSPQVYRFRLPVVVPRPQARFTARIKRFLRYLAPSTCRPRPGPLPRTLVVAAKTDAKGLAVAVRTLPHNREVSDCIGKRLTRALGDFGPGIWSLRARLRRPVLPTMRREQLANVLHAYATFAAQTCYRFTDSPPTVLRVSVNAVRDAKRFVISVSERDPVLQRCLSADIEHRLRGSFSTPRRRQDGKWERYFRIDASARARVTVKVAPVVKRSPRRRWRGF